jgi:hypothetical protein
MLKGEIRLHYEPVWVRHSSYQDLKTLLAEQPVLKDLNLFLNSVDNTAKDAVELMREINKESSAEMVWDVLTNGGWRYISSIYTDALDWHLGLNLDEPSDTDYIIKPVTSQDQKGMSFELNGGQQTDFAGPLIQTPEESDAVRLRALHLKLRLKYRSSPQAQQAAAKISLLRVQRKRILSVFSQLKPD